MPSGHYDRSTMTFNCEKQHRFKVIGFANKGTNDFWFFGVTKNYTCKYKAYYIYIAKKKLPHNKTNPMLNKIIELNYDFDAIEVELLPKSWTFKEAKLHLQNQYINFNNKLIIHNVYCFCPPEKEAKHRQPQEVKEQIYKLRMEGYSTREISNELKIEKKTVASILRYNEMNLKKLVDKAIEEVNKGATIKEIQEKYHFTKYLLNKVYQKANKANAKNSQRTN